MKIGTFRIENKKIKKSFKKMLTRETKSSILGLVSEILTKKWSLSSAGRASALQAGGHRFEPYSAHHFFYGLVVQLVRTLACHARGRRFEPVPGRQKLSRFLGSF